MNYSLSNVLGGGAVNQFDPDSEAWLASQGITDYSVRRRYSGFYTLCKALTPTLWSRLMMVSLRSNEAPLKTWGGGKSTFPSQLQGDFATVGTVTVNTDGATLAYASSFPNRVRTPTSFVYNTHRAEPWFIGMVYKNVPTSGTFRNSTSLVNWNIGTTSAFINNYSGGDAQTAAWQTGVGLPGAQGGQYVVGNAFANNSKDADQFIGFDFQSGRLSVAQLSNSTYGLATHASVSPNTSSINTGLWFFPAFNSTTALSGTLKYLVFFSAGIIDVAASERRLFWQIMRGTLLSTDTHIHFANGGQSLSTGTLQRQMQMTFNTTRTVTTEVYSYGGTYISAWVGADPNNPTRASQYSGGYWNSGGTGTTQVTWLYGVNTGVDKWIVWLQGESDTELRSTALVYQRQLQNLYNFLREDFQRDFRFAVNLLDYSLYYRTATAQGNFTLSGITGSGTAANGTWVITAIASVVSGGVVTNANASYSWTKSGGGTISLNGANKWEIAVSGVVYATSVESYTHPELCTWILSNGATGTLDFSESRTGNIERVRKAQADFVAANSIAVNFDSRGVTRPADINGTGDAVHPNTAGEAELALRAVAAMTA